MRKTHDRNKALINDDDDDDDHHHHLHRSTAKLSYFQKSAYSADTKILNSLPSDHFKVALKGT
jgi:hypothetical protein